jgi:DnaK suppressor protein
MDPSKLQQLKKALEEEKAMIEKQLLRIAQPNPDVKDDWIAKMVKPDQSDPPDEKAHSVTSYETRRAVEQRLEKRLQEINEALSKIENDNYGTCIECDNEIPDERLKAIPVTAHCIECKEKLNLTEI